MTEQPEVLTAQDEQKEKVRQAWAGAHAGRVNHISETDYPNRFAVFLVKAVPEDEFDIATMTGFLSTRLEAHRLKLIGVTSDRFTVTVELMPKPDEPEEDKDKSEPLPDLKTEAAQTAEPTSESEPDLILTKLNALTAINRFEDPSGWNKALEALWGMQNVLNPRPDPELLDAIEADLRQLRQERDNLLKANGILSGVLESLESENADLLSKVDDLTRKNQQQSVMLRQAIGDGHPCVNKYIPRIGVTPEQMREAERLGWREYFKWGDGNHLNIWFVTDEQENPEPLNAEAVAAVEAEPKRMIESTVPVTTIGSATYNAHDYPIRIVTPERATEPSLNQQLSHPDEYPDPEADAEAAATLRLFNRAAALEAGGRTLHQLAMLQLSQRKVVTP